MANKGYFILTDISGYTEFLTRSEIDHANDALKNLFDAQLAEIKHPFIISGYRGDAIFMYVPESDFIEAQSFIESIERLYFVFADTRRQMIQNTTCQCRACQNIPRRSKACPESRWIGLRLDVLVLEPLKILRCGR